MAKINTQIYATFTGLTRQEAAEALACQWSSAIQKEEKDGVATYKLRDHAQKLWQLTQPEGKMTAQKKGESGQFTIAGKDSAILLISPPHHTFSIAREGLDILREAGAVTNKSCGVWYELSGFSDSPRPLINLLNMTASKESLMRKTIGIPETVPWISDDLLTELREAEPVHNSDLANILLPFSPESSGLFDIRGFTKDHTIQTNSFPFRMEDLDRIEAGFQFFELLATQAEAQQRAVLNRSPVTNEKFEMRTWLVRLGMKGPEFETTRRLYREELSGNTAWLNPAMAKAQQTRIKEARQQEKAEMEADKEVASENSIESTNPVEPVSNTVEETTAPEDDGQEEDMEQSM